MVKQATEAEVVQLQKRINKLEHELADSKGETINRGFNWRTPIVIISVILAGATFSTAAMAFAFNRTINDTDAYMRSIGPIIEQPEVQKAVVKKGQELIQQNVDVNQIVTDSLPPQAAFLAGPITSQVNSQIDNILTKIVASDKFATVWQNTNRKLHDSTLNLIKSSDGNPTLDVSQLYQFLSTELQGTPLSAVANKSLPPKIGAIKVTDAKWIPVAHQTLADLPWIQNVGLLLAVVFGAIAVYLSNLRRRTGALLAIWIAVIMGVTVASLAASKSVALQDIADPVYKDAAGAIWSVVLAPLYGYLATLATLSVLAAIMLWATGGSRSASKVRSTTSSVAASIHKFIFRGHDTGQFFKYLRQYKAGLYWLILVVVLGLFIFLFRPLTVSIVLTSTFIGLVVAAIIQVIASE